MGVFRESHVDHQWMTRQLYTLVFAAIACALLVQGLSAYTAEPPKQMRAADWPHQQFPAEPQDPDCTGACADGYRWASENAINSPTECKQGSFAIREGCLVVVAFDSASQFDRIERPKADSAAAKQKKLEEERAKGIKPEF